MNTQSHFFYEKEKVIFNHPAYDHISKKWSRGNFYEIELLEYIRDLELSGCYVDVGAHHGNHTVFFSLFCQAEKVVAIEGSPINFEYLDANIYENICENVEPICILVGDEDKEEVNLYWREDNTGTATIFPQEQFPETISNAQRTLNDILENENDISLMKFDIQGAEWLALQGGLEVIEKHRPMIIMEMMKWNENRKEIEEYLENLDYRVIHTINGYSPVLVFSSLKG